MAKQLLALMALALVLGAHAGRPGPQAQKQAKDSSKKDDTKPASVMDIIASRPDMQVMTSVLAR